MRLPGRAGGPVLGTPHAVARVLADLPPWLPRYDLDIRLGRGAASRRRERAGHVDQSRRAAGGQSRSSMRMLITAFPATRSASMRKRWSSSAWPPARRSIPTVRRLTCKAFACWKHLAPVRCVSRVSLPFTYRTDNTTALEIHLPRAVHQNEQVTVELTFTMRLPQRQGRWGQWEGVTFLVQWLPVLAFYDDQGWQPTPFIPWHLPFFNEAGIYTAHITLPLSEKLAVSGTVVGERDVGGGWKTIDVEARACAISPSCRAPALRNSPRRSAMSAMHASRFPRTNFTPGR